MADLDKVAKELRELVALIKRLRAPDGCPWDRKQKPQNIGTYILEEAYEVIESLEINDDNALCEELGDLLFQILFLAEMGDETKRYTLEDVLVGIKEKMIRRHPHVFGDARLSTVEEVKESWQQIKNREQKLKNYGKSIFGNVPRSLPALKRAQKITALAAAYGFDWTCTIDVLKKLEEELSEFSQALNANDHVKVEEELGDIFFTLANLCRFVKVDAETALSKTTNKFLQRFTYVSEQLNSRGKSLEESSLVEMDALWNEAKKIGI